MKTPRVKCSKTSENSHTHSSFSSSFSPFFVRSKRKKKFENENNLPAASQANFVAFPPWEFPLCSLAHSLTHWLSIGNFSKIKFSLNFSSSSYFSFELTLVHVDSSYWLLLIKGLESPSFSLTRSIEPQVIFQRTKRKISRGTHDRCMLHTMFLRFTLYFPHSNYWGEYVEIVTLNFITNFKFKDNFNVKMMKQNDQKK